MLVPLTALSSRNLAFTLVVIVVSLVGWLDFPAAVRDLSEFLSLAAAVSAGSILMLFLTDFTPCTWRASVTWRAAVALLRAVPVRSTTPLTVSTSTWSARVCLSSTILALTLVVIHESSTGWAERCAGSARLLSLIVAPGVSFTLAGTADLVGSAE